MTVTQNSATGADRIDADRWPEVATAPRSPMRAAIARWLFHRAVARVPLRVHEGEATWYGAGTSTDPVFRLLRPDAFFRRLGDSGTIGFGEAFMAGDWTSDDLAGVLAVFARNVRTLVPATLQRLRSRVLAVQPHDADNTIEGARANIRRHYDLSNALFELFLDETMTYSSAIYAGEPSSSGDTLADAQRRKIDRLLDLTGVGAGTRVLEIGTGWGELSLRAAGRGAEVTSLTISAEQARLARERIAAAGLTDRVSVLEQDYRQVRGRFDVVVSVEMIEAVGANHWATYFQTIDQVLVPGGRVGLQAILQDDATMRATKDTYTWIRKYIFPGGQLASAEAIDNDPRQAHGVADLGPVQLQPALRRDAAPLAGAVRAECRRDRRARLRRDVPAHVVVLPRLLRGRVSNRVPRRIAVHDDQEPGVKR